MKQPSYAKHWRVLNVGEGAYLVRTKSVQLHPVYHVGWKKVTVAVRDSQKWSQNINLYIQSMVKALSYDVKVIVSHNNDNAPQKVHKNACLSLCNATHAETHIMLPPKMNQLFHIPAVDHYFYLRQEWLKTDAGNCHDIQSTHHIHMSSFKIFKSLQDYCNNTVTLWQQKITTGGLHN